MKQGVIRFIWCFGLKAQRLSKKGIIRGQAIAKEEKDNRGHC